MPLPPPALSDSQVVGVYCRQSKERLGGQMFGRHRGVLSVLLLIYILWLPYSYMHIGWQCTVQYGAIKIWCQQKTEINLQRFIIFWVFYSVQLRVKFLVYREDIFLDYNTVCQESYFQCFGSVTRGLKRSEMLNHHKIILLFTNIISFNWLLSMRKYYNDEIILYYFQKKLRNSSDPESGMRFLAGSGFN